MKENQLSYFFHAKKRVQRISKTYVVLLEHKRLRIDQLSKGRKIESFITYLRTCNKSYVSSQNLKLY